MVKLYKDKNVSVDFQVVRAYPTRADVMADLGIFFNFSACVTITAGKETTKWMSLNDLRVQQNEQGEWFIGSKGSKIEMEGEDGKIYSRGTIYPFSLLPGNANSPELARRQAQFMEELIAELEQFHAQAQEALHSKEKRGYKVPEHLARIAAQPKNKTSSKDNLPL